VLAAGELAEDEGVAGSLEGWEEWEGWEDLEAPPFPPFFEGLEYKSAYQPPPLRMKLPAEICRWAVFSLQAGQVSSGASTIRCSSSHSWPQAAHLYS
jgi:hypothetical protein